MVNKNDFKNEFVDKLTDILIKNGAFKIEESKSIKEDFHNRSKEAFDYFLLEEGLVSKKDLLKALSQYYQLNSIDVIGYLFDHDLLTNFPKDFLLRNAIIPLEVDDDILVIVANNPSDPDLLAKIGDYTSYAIEFMVGIKRDIIDSVEDFYDEPPEGYIHDTTDEDEIDDNATEQGISMDEFDDDKERW